MNETQRLIANIEAPLKLLALQKPGDIILVRRGQAWLSRIYQSMSWPAVYRHGFQAWRTLPSHVLIVVHPGLYMEAMPGRGVQLIAAESCRPGAFDHFQVLRHPADGFTRSELEALSHAFEWHYGQFYNYKINFTLWKRQFRSHSYCSELSACIYKQAGMPLCEGKPTNLILPVHLSGLGLRGEWRDVTAEYHEFDRLMEALQGEFGLLNLQRKVAAMRIAQGMKTSTHQELAFSVNKLSTMLKKRVRIQRFLARFSTRLAARYTRWALSDQVPEEVPLMPEIHLDALLEAIHLVDGADFLSRGNTWRTSDRKFQGKYQDAKRDSAMLQCLSAFAYCLAVRTFAAHAVLGQEGALFARCRTRLIEVMTLPEDFLVRLQTQVDTFPASLDDDEPFASLWQATANGFLAMAMLRKALFEVNADAGRILRSSAFWGVADIPWKEIAEKLTKDDEKLVLIQQFACLTAMDRERIVPL